MDTRRLTLASLFLIAGWLASPHVARAGLEYWQQNDVDGYWNNLDDGAGSAAVALGDEVHDFYREPSTGALRHVHGVAGWFETAETIDGQGGSRGEEVGDVGQTGIAAFEVGGWLYAFYGDASGNLRFAQRAPDGSWSVGTVMGPNLPAASGVRPFVSHVCAAAVFDGFQVIFSDHGQLQRAHLVGNGWDVQSMGFVSNASPDAAAIVSGGRLEVYFTDVGKLRLVTWDGTQAGGPTDVDGAGGNAGQVSGGIDGRPAAAFFQGQSHVFYRQSGIGNGSQTRVRHASGANGAFIYENLDGPGSSWTTTPPDRPGAWPSAAVVGNQLHVVYRNEKTCLDWMNVAQDGSQVRHARFVPDTGIWYFDDVYPYQARTGRGGACQTAGDARGEFTSLAVTRPAGDDKEWLWLFDYDRTEGDLLAADWEVPLDWTPDTCANVRLIPEQDTHYHGAIGPGTANDLTGSCAPTAGGDAIYKLVLTQSRRVRIDTLGSAIDTAIYLRTGGACPGSAEIPNACSNDAPGLTSGSLDRTLAAGTYYVVVDSATGATGAFNLNVTFPLTVLFTYPVAPSITASDTSWYWRTSVRAGWQSPSYIGSKLEPWFAAVAETPMGGGPWYSIPGMPPQTPAQWIWNWDSRNGTDTNTVYFRKWVTPAGSQATVFITADNAFTVWVNGVAAGSGDAWNQSYVFTVPVNPGVANLIAVQAVNAGGPGGLLVDVR